LLTLAVHFVVVLVLWGQYLSQAGSAQADPWFATFERAWIPPFGIGLTLAMDGLSLLLIALSTFLGLMTVAASWDGIQYRMGLFYLHVLWIIAALVGVFLALDLFLFYFFWEMMLVPLYFLIAIWGYENRIYAAIKMFIFTQASGLFMLLAILALYVIHGRSTGVYTFSYVQLLDTPLAPATALWLMLGFFIAFAVKLPVVPLHTWLPDAHTEAPTAGSVILAGLVLKAGAYGCLRFLIPLFPQATLDFAPVAIGLGVVGILYGAMVAFAQTDLKRLVAYTSVSHMGFVLIGIFSGNSLALQGAVVIMLAHGISTGALFILVGHLQDRLHTRDLNRLGGLWSTAPRLGGVGLLFAMATLGLPGLGNFVGEFLVLLGLYQVSVPLAVLATLGFVVATVYALWMVQRTFFGPNREGWRIPDATGRDMAVLGAMTAAIVWLGLFPQTVLHTVRPTLEALQRDAAGVPQAMRAGPGREVAAPPRHSPGAVPSQSHDGGV
jgi:NADH-quinone oxidoreductase subunit M